MLHITVVLVIYIDLFAQNDDSKLTAPDSLDERP